jgi:hypothetical protein
MRRVPFAFTTVISATTQNTKVFNPLTGYVPAGSVKKARVVFETAAAPAGISITQAFQTADAELGTPTTTEPGGQTPTTTNGSTITAVFDVSAATASRLLVRGGVMVANTGGNGQLACRVSGWWEIDDE